VLIGRFNSAQGCHDTFYKTCPVLDRTHATEHNCKKDNQCGLLEGMFICQLGICRNISEVSQVKNKEKTTFIFFGK
jgi:hypothetical protein